MKICVKIICMKVMANFSKPLTILLWIMFGISVAVAILAILVLCEIGLRLEITHAQAVLMLFTSTLVAVASLLMTTIHYKVTDTHLRLKMAFFDILGGRIRLEKILNIVIKDKIMYISYIWQGEDPVIARIAIAPKHYEDMKRALIAANKNILFFDEDKQTDTQE